MQTSTVPRISTVLPQVLLRRKLLILEVGVTLIYARLKQRNRRAPKSLSDEGFGCGQM